MKVISLFDGISCGYLALKKCNINIEKYVAFEIDNNAIKCSNYNFPDIIQKGNVINADFTEYKNFDLLIGGSPCQNLSSMGNHKGLDGKESGLFFEYLRALEEIQPKYFLLENNASMSIENKKLISDLLRCDPVLIDSGDFSAQNRKRFYWTNIPIKPYKKKNILLKDILEDTDNHKNCVDDIIQKYLYDDIYKGRKIRTCVKESIKEINQKSRTIGCRAGEIGNNTSLIIKIKKHYYKPTQTEFERLQTLPDHYTQCLNYNNAVRAIGNGWTVDVIAHIFSGLN